MDNSQARRQGGFEGVRSNSPFDLQTILYTLLYILSVLTFESGPLISLLLRITVVQTSLVAAMQVCSWRTSVERGCPQKQRSTYRQSPSYIFFTLATANGDLPKTYHMFTAYCQFMVVTSFSGHFLLPHGLGMRLV